MNELTLEDFKDFVMNEINKLPSNWRKGQKVFNFIDNNYGIARKIQFEEGIDCFYNDDAIDDFIKEAHKIITYNG